MNAWYPQLAFPNGLGVAWPLVARDFPIAVCWAHKSANTTMLKWFLFQTGLLKQAVAEYPDRIHLFWHAHITAQPNYGEQCFHALAGPIRKLTVKVVRDPAHRAVSSFIHFIRDPHVVFHDTWAAFLDWKRSQGLAPTLNASFSHFLRFVCDSRADGKPLDHHLQPQWNPAQDPFVMRYIPLEKLGPGLHALERLCGLRESPLDALSQSPHHSPPPGQHPWPADAAGMPLDGQLLRQLGGPPASVLLNATTRPLISEAFTEDYAAYERFYADFSVRCRDHGAPTLDTRCTAA
ncbi:MAG: sulfotransferase family 2 domain-containing protein [Pirellulales bacterium]